MDQERRVAEIEAGAAELLASIGNPTPPVSALALANALGLAVKRGFPGIPTAVADTLRARLLQERSLIEVSPALTGRALHEAVAHELGYWALWHLGLPQSHTAARVMAAALMMPLAHFSAGAPIEQHLVRHSLCSLSLIETRCRVLSRRASSASSG